MSIPVVARQRFMVGKYEVIAQPLPNSAHMLRYTVYLDAKRIGAMVSVPTESDCRFMERPPAVPPLVPYQSTYRPGRPKKSAPPRTPGEAPPPPREEVPAGVWLPERAEDR
jgi:hypothetical protein